MTLGELRDRWAARRDEWQKLGVHVDGAALAGEIIADLAQLEASGANDLASPADAAARTGYHPESIARLARNGKVRNYGTKHRPRVSVAEIASRRSTNTRVAPTGLNRASSADAIARDAVAGRLGRPRLA
jgi:hypothetical protein